VGLVAEEDASRDRLQGDRRRTFIIRRLLHRRITMKRNLVLAVLIVLATVVTAGEYPKEEGTWQTLPPMPTPRHDLEAVTWGGKIFAISGAGESTVRTVEVFDPKTGKWEASAPIPEERGWFGAAIIDGKLYCVGGKRVRSEDEKKRTGNNDHYEFRASVNIYDFAQGTWTFGPPLCGPRTGLKAAACAGKLYAIAGNGQKEGVRVEVYDPRTNEWTFGVPLPANRCAPGVAVVQDRICVFGGYGEGGERSETFIYNTKLGEWTKASPMPTNRRDLAAVAIGTKIYCVAGVSNGKYTPAVEVYDTEKDTWAIAPPLAVAKAWVGACGLSGKLYVMGGANNDGAKYIWRNEMEVYTPEMGKV